MTSRASLVQRPAAASHRRQAKNKFLKQVGPIQTVSVFFRNDRNLCPLAGNVVCAKDQCIGQQTSHVRLPPVRVLVTLELRSAGRAVNSAAPARPFFDNLSTLKTTRPVRAGEPTSPRHSRMITILTREHLAWRRRPRSASRF